MDQKREEIEASNGMVCGSKQVSMYEMQGSKYMKMPRKCTGPKMSCQKVWENGECAIWEVMTWSEEWTDKVEVLMMVQKVFGIREAKNGTETDELLQTGTDGHQRVWRTC